MASPNERVVAIEAWSRLKPADFARKTGIKPGTLSKAKKGPFAPSAATMNRITTAFPQLNPAWVLSGNGEMLAGPAEATHQESPLTVVPETDEVKELKERVKWLERQVELWQRIATSGIDLSKVATGTDGPGFPEGNHNSAENQVPTMWLTRAEPLAA